MEDPCIDLNTTSLDPMLLKLDYCTIWLTKCHDMAKPHINFSTLRIYGF
jgi:hypothetical protein